eukprot:g757.t1
MNMNFCATSSHDDLWESTKAFELLHFDIHRKQFTLRYEWDEKILSLLFSHFCLENFLMESYWHRRRRKSRGGGNPTGQLFQGDENKGTNQNSEIINSTRTFGSEYDYHQYNKTDHEDSSLASDANGMNLYGGPETPAEMEHMLAQYRRNSGNYSKYRRSSGSNKCPYHTNQSEFESRRRNINRYHPQHGINNGLEDQGSNGTITNVGVLSTKRSTEYDYINTNTTSSLNLTTRHGGGGFMDDNGNLLESPYDNENPNNSLQSNQMDRGMDWFLKWNELPLHERRKACTVDGTSLYSSIETFLDYHGICSDCGGRIYHEFNKFVGREIVTDQDDDLTKGNPKGNPKGKGRDSRSSSDLSSTSSRMQSPSCGRKTINSTFDVADDTIDTVLLPFSTRSTRTELHQDEDRKEGVSRKKEEEEEEEESRSFPPPYISCNMEDFTTVVDEAMQQKRLDDQARARGEHLDRCAVTPLQARKELRRILGERLCDSVHLVWWKWRVRTYENVLFFHLVIAVMFRKIELCVHQSHEQDLVAALLDLDDKKPEKNRNTPQPKPSKPPIDENDLDAFLDATIFDDSLNNDSPNGSSTTTLGGDMTTTVGGGSVGTAVASKKKKRKKKKKKKKKKIENENLLDNALEELFVVTASGAMMTGSEEHDSLLLDSVLLDVLDLGENEGGHEAKGDERSNATNKECNVEKKESNAEKKESNVEKKESSPENKESNPENNSITTNSEMIPKKSDEKKKRKIVMTEETAKQLGISLEELAVLKKRYSNKTFRSERSTMRESLRQKFQNMSGTITRR